MDIEEIKHLAELSKLEFDDQELVNFYDEFCSLIELADTVKNADIHGQSYIEGVKMANLREDEAKESMPVELLLENTPVVKKECIVVPRILE